MAHLLHFTRLLTTATLALVHTSPPQNAARAGAQMTPQLGRRAAAAAFVALPTSAARAAKDCFTDCSQNCARNAPGSLAYCKDTCADYCAQPDRRDGLSGSVSADAGETGFASAYDYANRITGRLNSNVEYGTDRLPPVPGLEGTAAGRKLAEAAGIRRGTRQDPDGGAK
mmetsp:Transcript_14474/g.44060  ORF Transcript_14474/g.44060 Transcript_14474/m.44060 type:complete len:170 (+) Transcript_14474:39-548(+)